MDKPKGIITPKEAKALNDAFTARCELISRDIVKRPDNRSSWFSLQDLRTYLDYAENQAKELGYEMNGVRIYCGANPVVRSKVGYSTAFIVPTTEVIDGKDAGGENKDIPEGEGLNDGQQGDPPNANYPQN